PRVARGAHARSAARPGERRGTAPMLEVRDVAKRFGPVAALGGISFTGREGEVLCFVGPNGAGKTTTMRILAGIFPPSSGEVRVAGHDPQRESLACRRAGGYFSEH